MFQNSLIYRNIFLYRLVMKLLYKGEYYKRFETVCKLIEGKKVTELCFGDLVVAKYCRQQNIEWTGIDVSKHFVRIAKRKGFKASVGDIHTLAEFPKADVCVMCGSLYHFVIDIDALFLKLLACAPRIIISEPIHNLSERNDWIGALARKAANVKGEKQGFRYTEETLLSALNIVSKKFNFSFKVIEKQKKDIVVLIER